jgi:adenine phosphoribosyltransferase
MLPLQHYIRDIPDFPKPGILFRDITPLLRNHLDETLTQLSALLEEQEWASVDVIAGIEARGFILAAALATRHAKGFVPIRKEGKLPPPVTRLAYELEYGTSALEMQRGQGRLLIVDDVLATGGTMAASAALAHQGGYEIASLIALIDLNLMPDFRWNGRPVRSVVRY